MADNGSTERMFRETVDALRCSETGEMHLRELPDGKLAVLHRTALSVDLSTCADELLRVAAYVEVGDLTLCLGLLERHFGRLRPLFEAGNEQPLSASWIVTGLNQFAFEMTVEQEIVLVDASARFWLATSKLTDDDEYDDPLMDRVFPSRGPTGKSLNDSVWLADNLARLVLDRPDQVDRIVETVVQRRITDAGHVAAIIDSGVAAALTAGVL